MEPKQTEEKVYRCPICKTGYVKKTPCGDRHCRQMEKVPIAELESPIAPKLDWEETLNNSCITGHISGRHLIQINVKEDQYDENEYVYLDEWIKNKKRIWEKQVRNQTLEEASEAIDSLQAEKKLNKESFYTALSKSIATIRALKK